MSIIIYHAGDQVQRCSRWILGLSDYYSTMLSVTCDASIHEAKEETRLLALPAPTITGQELVPMSADLTVNCSDESNFVIQHTEATIKLYLDLIHGLTVDNVDTVQLVELVLFLVDDDKYSE